MQKVLIAGATGYLGRFAVKAFYRRGFEVRALTRSPGRLDDLKDAINEEVVGEVTQKDSLKGLCEGVDIVFSSVGITKQKDGLAYMDVDYQGNANLLEEAMNAGVKKFVYVSVFKSKEITGVKPVEAKLRFEEKLISSGIDYTIVYPNGFFSDMLEYLRMAAKGKGYVLGKGDKKINPIHGADLAEVCVDAAVNNEKAVDAGGPDIFTHREITEMAFRTLDKPVKIMGVPFWAAHSFLALMKIFTSIKTYGPIQFFLTVVGRDLVAPAYGTHHLKDFFAENKEAVR